MRCVWRSTKEGTGAGAIEGKAELSMGRVEARSEFNQFVDLFDVITKTTGADGCEAAGIVWYLAVVILLPYPSLYS